LNLTFAPAAKFVRRYADAGSLIRSAIEHYRDDVEHHAFPSDEESYHLPESAKAHLLRRPDGGSSHGRGIARMVAPGAQ